MEQVAGQRSAVVSTNCVRAYVTELGGQMGPARFRLGERWVEPFSVAPWAREEIGQEHAPIIRVLRGDFFCMPFGANVTPFGGETHPLHGDTANRRWLLLEEGNRVVGELRTVVRPGKVRKEIFAVADQTAVYSRHLITEMEGPMNYGHHAMLAFKSQGHVSTSAFGFGQVYPGQLENAAGGGYSSLKAGAQFSDLAQVPMNDGGVADLTKYPAREGYEDLVMVCSDPSVKIAWTAVSFPEENYMWFSIKDPRTLASTLLWHSNGGRHYAPWNGRHRAVLGLEDVTSYFHTGLAESCAPNPVSQAGYKTCINLSPSSPLDVRYIMGVAETPAGFGRVTRIEAEADKIAIFSGEKRAETKVNVGYLLSA